MTLLSALQFTEGDAKQFPFGVSAQAAADLLRSLGDQIESGEICVISVSVTGLASANEYAKTNVHLVLIEKQAGNSQDANEFGSSEQDS